MTFDEFKKLIDQEPDLKRSLERAASPMLPPGRQRWPAGTGGDSFGPVSAAAGLGALVILFPVVNRIVWRIGLPWLSTLERYSEMWRHEVERWLDEEYNEKGFDPDISRAVSESLLKELQETTDAETRSAWQRFLDVLKKDE